MEKTDELIRLAESGNVDAQVTLGARYATGDGAPKAPAKSICWYKKAAKSGSLAAKWNIAIMLLNGEGGLVRNRELAISIIETDINLEFATF